MMHDLVVPQPQLRPRQNDRASLTDVAYDAVVEAIFDRQIEPGARLRIDALAAELGVSITPVREALARTTAAGLTRLDVNRGYSVTPVLDADGFHQLFAARRTIESAAVRGEEHAPAAWVSRLAPTELRGLRSLVAKMSKVEHGASYADYSKFSRLDHQLHFHLVRLGGNKFYATAWESLHFHLHMSRLYAGAGVVDYDDAHSEHAAIAAALEARNGPALWRSCEAHISRAEKRLISLVPDSPEES
jgi:DNA-binding GntR family transcriptional regulator